MICDRILGHIDDAEFASTRFEFDALELTWQECRRRFLRKKSCGGREVGLLLPVASHLCQGDVVFVDANLVIYVAVPPTRVLVIRVHTLEESAAVAYEMGSLHCPVEITPEAIIIPADDAMEALLTRRGFPFMNSIRPFQPMEQLPELGVRLSAEFQLTSQLS